MNLYHLFCDGIPPRSNEHAIGSWRPSQNKKKKYAGLVVPVQCDAIVDTPCLILCGFIFSWSEFIRCSASSLLWCIIPKSSTVRVNFIPFLL